MSNRESWSSNAGFLLANIGSAIGLGSIWKFPYEVGTNGGSAFVLFYLLGLALIVFPLMLVELTIGRRGRGNAVESMGAVARASGARRGWALVGGLGIVTSFLILSYYSVIGGWAVAYAVDTLRYGLIENNLVASQNHYNALLASPLLMAAYHAAFMAIAALIVARGIAAGIEAACKVLMPVLIGLMLVLALYAMIEGDVMATLRFLFAFDTRTVTPKTVIEALGLGFFSIGVGLAVMLTYAAYADAWIDLRRVAVITIVSDTAISFLAGLAVFPIVFAEKLDPSSGPGLIFVTLPLAFAGMPFGRWIAAAFFVLLTVAGIASAISMLEMPVALLRRWPGWQRPLATVVAASLCWIIGLGSVLSFNLWAGWTPLSSIAAFGTATLFDLLDYLTSNVLLPITGFLLAVFGGWIVSSRLFAEELGMSEASTAALRFVLRYVAPFGIAVATLVPFMS